MLKHILAAAMAALYLLTLTGLAELPLIVVPTAASEAEAIRTAARQAGDILYDDCAAVPIGCSVRYQAWSCVWYGVKTERSTGLAFTGASLPRQLQGISAGGK